MLVFWLQLRGGINVTRTEASLQECGGAAAPTEALLFLAKNTDFFFFLGYISSCFFVFAILWVCVEGGVGVEGRGGGMGVFVVVAFWRTLLMKMS